MQASLGQKQEATTQAGPGSVGYMPVVEGPKNSRKGSEKGKDPDGPGSPGSTCDIIDPAALGLLAATYSYVLPYSYIVRSTLMRFLLSAKWARRELKSVFFLPSPFSLCLSRVRAFESLLPLSKN